MHKLIFKNDRPMIAQISHVMVLLRNVQVDFLKMTSDCVFHCLISHVNVLLCNAQVDY